jgi:dTDP-L-rhamnose 4-epimerase
MKVLVTGGAGFIGSHTVDGLLQRGYQVTVLDALEPPVHATRERPEYLPPDAELIVGDVRSRDDWLKALRGVQAVIHLAAYQDYRLDFSKFSNVNGTGTALLYELLVEQHLPIERVVIASSQAVYGEGGYTCTEHGALFPGPRPLAQLEAARWDTLCPRCGREMAPRWTDETVVQPQNQYAISKYTQELYAFTLGRLHKIPTVAARYSIVHGPRQSPRNAYSGVLRIFSTCLLGGTSPAIYEDGAQLRDYIPIQDVVAANILLLEHPDAVGRAFNVGGGQALTVLEYFHMLKRLTGSNTTPTIPRLFRLGDVRHILSDITALKQLGWAPKTPLEETAAQYLAWLSTQRVTATSVQEALNRMREAGILREAQ